MINTVAFRPQNELQELGPSRMEEVELKLVLEGRGTSIKERGVHSGLEEAPSLSPLPQATPNFSLLLIS